MTPRMEKEKKKEKKKRPFNAKGGGPIHVCMRP
jgi:hypothetical protein